MLIFCVILFVQSSGVLMEEESGSLSVKGLDTGSEVHIGIDAENCRVSDRRITIKGMKDFKYNLTSLPLHQGQCQDTFIIKEVPDHIKSIFKDYAQDKYNYTTRKCNIWYRNNSEIECFFDFYIKEHEEENQTTKNDNATDQSVIIYASVAAVILIVVLAQTGCLIVYNRKVKRTQRALQKVLYSKQGNNKNENDRYSTGPVPKKNLRILHAHDSGERIYESLENIAAKSKKTHNNFHTINSTHSIKDRPRLPLPHEMKSWDEVATFPRKPRTHSPGGESGRRNAVPKHPAQNANWTNPRTRPHMPPHIPNIMGELNLAILKQQHHFPSSTSLHRQAMARMPSTTTVGQPSTTPVSHRSVRAPFKPRPPPPEPRPLANPIGDSSDEEWEYEKLPPTKKYLV